MTEGTEPRALSAALSAPRPFTTRGGRAALHAADRHVERWAPEGSARGRRGRGSLGTLGFVDRLVSPWLERPTAGLRMFDGGATERDAGAVSWVFPRPWHPDELDWMAAARESQVAAGRRAQPASLGYVAPSLSLAKPARGEADPFSPLVPFAASQAARWMARAFAPLTAQLVAPAPGLRAVLATLLDRAAAAAAAVAPIAAAAPELVTPPAPRREVGDAGGQVADHFAAQRAQLAELEHAVRAPHGDVAARREVDAQAELERARLQQRIDARLAERTAQQAQSRTLHARARELAARDAASIPAGEPAPEPRLPAEVATALAALPAELSSLVASALARHPDRPGDAVGQITQALRAVELMARTAAGGGTVEPGRGPRLALPAGLGGLVSAVQRTPALPRAGRRVARSALEATAAAAPAALGHVAWADRWLARMAGAGPESLDLLATATGQPQLFRHMLAPEPVFVAAAPRAVVRYDDDAETPDEVFAQISAAASRSRTAPPPAAPRAEATPPKVARDTLADVVAHGVPAAPDAGLSAQLASSPFAPALRHVMPLGAAPSFDVRALFGEGLGETYLAGWLSAADDTRELLAWEPAYVASELAEPAADPGLAPLVTLRSALLSWQVAESASPDRALARTLIDAMALPLLGEPDASIGFTAPGMIGDRAHAWSVAQERATSELALDFVPPELVLAARVYGLGPAEAAQAARLALAGPGELGAMASTVDRTFVQVLQIEAERAGRAPVPGDGGAEPRAPGKSSAFGIDRRTPRGAVLWPQATIASLGMTAAAPDGERSMSVAALELIAARSVAELGTRSALGEARAEQASAEAGDAEVLETALPLVPAARRTKFEALFVALGETAAGRSQSPAARAARALALAGRGDEVITARERAAVAWDVLPHVHAGEPGARDASSAAMPGETRPGLAALSARAGEAIGSYVTTPAPQPTAPARAPAAPPTAAVAGAVLRAPTAAHELVRTGRPSGRHGGGEVEIPAWFEAAARKMLADRSGASDGISLAELTLISAAPSSHVAASSKGTAAAAPASPSAADGGDHGHADSSLDIEQIAQEVYEQILSIMDATRSRNGDSFL